MTLLALRTLSSASFGAAARAWLSDLGFGLFVMGIPAAVASIALLAHASVARVLFVRWFAPTVASVEAVAAAYGTIAVVAVIAAFPAWFPVSVAIAGSVVAGGVHRTTGAAPA